MSRPLAAHAPRLYSPTRWGTWMLAASLTVSLAGCNFAPQRHFALQDNSISLTKGELETHGLAFLTPSTVTGQEEDRQALALTFSSVLAKQRPQIRIMTLPRTLGAVNRAGLSEQYRQMYDEYRNTGIFRKETLRQISQVAGSRYLAQLKLSDFRQNTQERFGAVGLRILQTQIANVRIFLQIWDAQEGTIAWEATQEFKYSDETVTERSITFKTVVEEAAQHMIERLP